MLDKDAVGGSPPDLVIEGGRIPPYSANMRTYITFGDLEGKLEVLRIECSRCQRKGRYTVAKLIDRYGRRGNMMKWKEQLNGALSLTPLCLPCG